MEKFNIAEIMQQNLLVKNASAREDGDVHLKKAAELLGLNGSHFNDQIKKQAFTQVVSLLAKVPWGTIIGVIKNLPWKSIIAILADEDTRKMVFEAPSKIKESLNDIFSPKGDTKEGVGLFAKTIQDYDEIVDKLQSSYKNLGELADNNGTEEELENAKKDFVKAAEEHAKFLEEIESVAGNETKGDIEVGDKTNNGFGGIETPTGLDGKSFGDML